MSAMGRQRPLRTLPAQRPLSGIERTFNSLEIANIPGRFREKRTFAIYSQFLHK